jgi:hypothetical protein
MNIDQKYLSNLLKPLENESVLTLNEYLAEIESLGVVVSDDNKKPTEMFDIHLNYMSAKKMISNMAGQSDLKSLGFRSTLSGSLLVVGNMKIMKVEKDEVPSNSTINFNAPVTNQQAQFGNGNTQNVTINMQELVEKVAASGDKEAKGILMKLLENPTISGVIGASVTGLIGMLG